MISRKEIILNILLSILVFCVGISYIYELRRTHELMEEMSMENLLEENGQKYESDVNREEIALKLCEGEILRKRAYIDKCIDSNAKQEQTNLNFPEEKEKGLQEILKIGQEKLDECFEDRNGLKNKYPDCFPEVSKSPNEENIFRNDSSVNKIKNFVLFLGYARCGGSIVTALLDSHPHVVVSHELNAVQIWFNKVTKREKFDKFELFNMIREKAKYVADLRSEVTDENQLKYYSLYIPGLYLGQYKDYVQVIGDKKGRSLVLMDKGVHDSKQFFQMMERFQNFVSSTLKLFHIVRNPYDNIATIYLYSISAEARKEAVTNNRTFEATQQLRNLAQMHVGSFEKIQRHIAYFGERLITLYNEDLISNPKLFIKSMCNHMEIYCDDFYLEKTSEKIFSSATKSRYSVEWKQDVRNMVDTAINRYPFLNRYSFDS